MTLAAGVYVYVIMAKYGPGDTDYSELPQRRQQVEGTSGSHNCDTTMSQQHKMRPQNLYRLN